MKKLLIIEDDEKILPLFKKKFGHEFDLKIATKGDEGLDLANTFSPDFIILDLVLPGAESGMHVLMELKSLETTKKIPVLVLTNLEGQTQLALENGAIDCIIKTDITMEKLIEIVHQHLNHK